MQKAKIGLIGLGTMGANLARNIANNGFPIVVFNRTKEKTEKFIKEHKNENISAEFEIKKFIEKIELPRKIIIMVKAGKPVDSVISQITPFLNKEDIIIDCGNENFKNTQKRFKELKEKEINFIGCGVSGGEEGALNGPSMMPGGSQKAWKKIKEIIEKISAKDFSKKPCVTYIGDNGAGHYIKMVHNGIEYGVMQIMAEAYDLLKNIYELKTTEIAEIFENFNKGKLSSYLFEISISVLKQKDEFQDGYLIDYILDKAAQKGTGKWTAIDALERGIALPTISEAVNARFLSSEKEKRIKISKLYKKSSIENKIPLNDFIKKLENALYLGMLSSYAQGYELIQKAAKEENWEINLSEISRIWEGGCIIRAKILNRLHKAYSNIKKEKHIFEIPEFIDEISNNIKDLRKITAFAAIYGQSVTSLATALSYIETMTNKNSSANFIQGLRDYFGAHSYERTDRKGDFHTNWT